MSKLILIRHGQSIWNKLNLFTGWVDVPLSAEGVAESLEAGLKIQNLPIDVVFTSMLLRAQMTVTFILLHHSGNKTPIFQHLDSHHFEEWSKVYDETTKKQSIPVYTAWELNERMYGKLQGTNKAEAVEKFGKKQVDKWRRSYEEKPPGGESLAMTIERALPYFKKEIVPYLEQGKNVLVASHGNSLRGILMYLDQLSKEEVVNLEIATASPLTYTYFQGQWTKIQ